MDTNNLLDNESLAFGEESVQNGTLRHPFVTFFHVAFRLASLIVYIFCGFSSSGFIGSFVFIILLISIDFWTVKNITGRLMVGLRWWNYIDEEGNSHWVYESKKARISPVESQIFWVGLFAGPLAWSILLLIAFARFNLGWMIVVCIALSLSSSNLYGYVRCRIGKSEGVTQSIKNFVGGIAQQQMVSNMTSYFTKSPPTNSQTTNI